MTLRAARRAFTRSLLLSDASLSRHAGPQNAMIICHRFFSKYEKIEVQEDSQTAAQKGQVAQPPKSKSQPTTLSSSKKRSVEEIAEKLIIAEHKSQMEFDDARRLLFRICAEAQALLSHNEISSSSEEIVATADYFLILTNDEELDHSVATIQALQRVLLDEHQADQFPRFLTHDGELARAVSAMNQLHRVFLAMIDNCIPPISLTLTNSDNDGKDHLPDKTTYDKEKYSAKTVARAIQLSRRAEDLGMPLHRPMYRRLAISVTLTYFTCMDDQDNVAVNDDDAPAPMQECLHPPIAMNLIDLCVRARDGLKIPSSIFSIERDPLEAFAAEILSDPLLLLLKRKQWKEAMMLLHGWREHFGRSESVNLIGMLGEDATLKVLEIAKGWVVGEKLGKDAPTIHWLAEFTNLLQESLQAIMDERKSRAEKLSRILPQLVWQLESPSDEEELDSDGSDSEFEEEFDSDEDEDWDAQSSARDRDFATNTANTITMDFNVDLDDETDPIIAGMSNKDARQRIYIRNGSDWSLPDVVGQLEEWNKGKPLEFTTSFERYLGDQMTKEDEEDFD